MPALPHLPALRRGKPYASLEQADVKDCRTGEPLARLSQVNAGIIRKDLARVSEAPLAGLAPVTVLSPPRHPAVLGG